MSGQASRRKGAAGELEVAHILAGHGFDCHRTPNSGGLAWRGDLQGIPDLCIEVKRQETLAIPAWLRQTHAAARNGETPVLIFRRNARTPTDPLGNWHATLPLDELAKLLARLRELEAAA